MLLFGLGGLFYGMDSWLYILPRCTHLHSRRAAHQCCSNSFRRPLSCKKYEHSPHGIYLVTPTYCCWTHTDALHTVGWTASATEPGFGGQRDDASVKARLINLVSSVRTLMRSAYPRSYAG
ncbi:hypothetical protein DE146DRAFT_367827 [Phaeosphaeria sp. MPI-PUGE-AT-0046c]|nr:hypothetical protein DE146DRAFT_367827 [Phaeosphaeria sp. MPI-PUGE-AT-0046c]